MEGIKRVVLPYDANSSSPTFAIMNLQMMARFPYFHSRINMLKWWSSIFRFRKKNSFTFIIQQPIETYKKALAICEFVFSKYSEFGPFRPWFFFKVQIILSC
jgi:hypothetical protein